MMKNGAWRWSLVIGLCAFVSGGTSISIAQDQDGSRGIESTEVLKRPVMKSPVKKPRRRVTYRATKPFIAAQVPNAEYAQLGISIWRLLKQDGSNPKECREGKLLQRVEGGSPLAIGSMVRIGIEPLTHDGFLYVVNREQFADGTYGTPYLISPTLLTREGINWVRKNELWIPKETCFRINTSKTGKTQVAEVLTIIISPTQLQLPEPISKSKMTLSEALFTNWVSQWSPSSINILEMNIGASLTGSAKVQVEGERSLDEVQDAQQLTDEDPEPTTVYGASVKKGGALLVTVSLNFKASSAPAEAKVP